MSDFFICKEDEIKEARNECDTYYNFLIRKMTQYYEIVKKFSETGVEGVSVVDRIRMFYQSFPFFVSKMIAKMAEMKSTLDSMLEGIDYADSYRFDDDFWSNARAILGEKS